MVDVNVKKACEYFGIDKKYVQSKRAPEDLKKYIKLKPIFEKHGIKLDEFVKVPKGQIIDASVFTELKQIAKPTLATRMKRVPSVLMNILKHIK